MMIERKTNGYDKRITAELTDRLTRFEQAAELVFGMAIDTISEFFYGDKLVMVDVVLNSGGYGQFNVSARRISFNGHTCTFAEYEAFERLTFNDELHKGGIIK